MAQVVVKNLHKNFAAFEAVKDVNLQVGDGEFVVLVGPSGCGKSTTLRMIAGLEEASAGDIWIGGRLVNDLAPKDRDIAMVFQNYALYPHMSVFDNMAFGLRRRKFGRDEVRKRVSETAEILGIQDLMDRKPRQLSGGQRQRVALGRAIVRDPQVFLFDEPLSNLDAVLRVQTRVELKRLHTRIGSTAIYVTHDQVEAMTLGDRVVVMCGGAVQQVATPIDLYRHPSNRFVAGFIGSPAMNLVEVDLRESAGVMWAETDSLSIRLTPEQARRLSSYRPNRITLGVRPEHLCIAAEGQEASCAFVATVDIVEQLGSDLLLNLTVGGIQLTARVDPQLNLAVNDKIQMTIDQGRVLFFHIESGDAF